MTDIVPLIRWFMPIDRTYEKHGVSLEELWPVLGTRGRKEWQQLLDEYRTVVFADAGAGKTFELKAEATRLAAKGRAAFFIRIEDIDAKFGNAFEVGTSDAFEAWLAGTGDAWFFLDSVDEVRLDEPRAFENAIRAFAARIHSAMQRAHVYISSRPYAWRSEADRQLVEALLPWELPRSEARGDHEDRDAPRPARVANNIEPESPLELYRLAPLDPDDIRIFAGHRNVEDVEALLADVERTGLFELARLPFDLEDILATWSEEKSLDSRLAVLERGIRRRLAPPRTFFGSPAVPIDRALEGALLLAVAATLTGEANIRLPGAGDGTGIDAAALLEGWTAEDVKGLLSRGIFSDAIYNMVRFRHREVRELLAARWFAGALADPLARGDLEGLMFREIYGEVILVPTLRPILPWLILFDEPVRARALALHPEIATEGGDAARLPLADRRKILADIVDAIVVREERGGDNSAIARIAQRDLDADAVALIDRHYDHDDAIFFLGRLVWQGRMTRAAERLVGIARDTKRGIYARLVSVRAVATVSGEEARRTLWSDLNAVSDALPRRLLTELVEDAATDEETVRLLLVSIGELEPYEPYKPTGLTDAIHRLIERLPVKGAQAPSQPLAVLVEGLVELLKLEPHIERRECKVSKVYRWLMAPAMHAVEKLITGRAKECFEEPVLTVLTLLPALRMWDDRDDRERASALERLVPRWIELNDHLFWHAVAERRQVLEAKGERLDDDWQVTMHGHFWNFDTTSFERTLGWIGSRALDDDRKVALTRSFRTFALNNRPKPWLKLLKNAVEGHNALETVLARLIKPPTSEDTRKWRATERQWTRRRRLRDEKEARWRVEFADRLKANPDLVRVPPRLKPGQMSNDQYNLLQMVEGDGVRTNRTRGADWQALIPEFGEAVAEAYRDGAVRMWRGFRPGLRSEGTNHSIPYALIFAMAGLDIEAGEDGNGLNRLDDDDARLALRYSLWELNGFPRWFEPLYRAHPELGAELIWGEMRWELENSDTNEPLHYLLHDVVYYAPWLHEEMAIRLVDWLVDNEAPNVDCLRYARHIMTSGGISPATLAAIARSKARSDTTPMEQLPNWFALWIDADPDDAIPALKARLNALKDSATKFAEAFLVSLMGGRHGNSPVLGGFRTPEHLKTLYLLMHKHIRVADDIERAGKGVYSPTLRDDAQDARNRLFSLLSQIPGEATYRAMLELAVEHPEEDFRLYMRRHARERAIADGDIVGWSLNEVLALLARLGKKSDSPRQFQGQST